MNLHTTPRLGGVSVIAGFFAPILLFAIVKTGLMRGFLTQPELVVGLVIGSLVVGVVGAIDDVRGLGPWAKLGAQAVAACVAYTFGYRIDAVNIPFFGSLDMGLAGPIVTVIWFLAITNAINLIDGLDGLAGGIAFFAASANLCLAAINNSVVVVLLSSSLGGALLGFLRYNFHPASIFLGDAGSMFLGFVLAATSIAGSVTKSSTAVAIFAPMIALGVPILDTLLAMVRRSVARKPLFSADRGHIHHRLLDLGLTHRRVVLLLYVSSILLAGAAIGVAFDRSWHTGLALVVAAAVLLTLVRTATHQQPQLELQHPQSTPETQPQPALQAGRGSRAPSAAGAVARGRSDVVAHEPMWMRLLERLRGAETSNDQHALQTLVSSASAVSVAQSAGLSSTGSSFVGGLLSPASAASAASGAHSTRACENCPAGSCTCALKQPQRPL